MVYYCDVCGNSFQHSKTLNCHIKTKHQANLQCNERFNNEKNLSSHMKSALKVHENFNCMKLRKKR